MRILAFSFFAMVLGAARPSGATETLDLSSLLTELRQNNPTIAERRLKAEALAVLPRAVGAWSDPTLSLEWWQQPTNFATYPFMLSARQALPWPGRLARSESAAEAASVAEHEALQTVVRQMEAEMKRAYVDLWLAERSLELGERIRELLVAVVSNAETRYKSGNVAQMEILLAQSDLLSVENDQLDLGSTKEQTHARINELLGRASTSTLAATVLEFPSTALPLHAELVGLAQDKSTYLNTARAQVKEAEARSAVADSENAPELSVWFGYMRHFGASDTFTAGVSTSLPVFSTAKKNALKVSAEAEAAAKKAALRAAERQIDTALQVACVQIEAAHRHERLHVDKLIPLAEMALRASLAGYQSARLDLLSVLAAAKMLRSHHANHYRFVAERERRLADLELILGQDLVRTPVQP